MLWLSVLVLRESSSDCTDSLMPGHHWYPSFPDIAGSSTFTGEVIHSKSFREPSSFKGKKVLIIGRGDSGIQIGTHDPIYFGPA